MQQCLRLCDDVESVELAPCSVDAVLRSVADGPDCLWECGLGKAEELWSLASEFPVLASLVTSAEGVEDTSVWIDERHEDAGVVVDILFCDELLWVPGIPEEDLPGSALAETCGGDVVQWVIEDSPAALHANVAGNSEDLGASTDIVDVELLVLSWKDEPVAVLAPVDVEELLSWALDGGDNTALVDIPELDSIFATEGSESAINEWVEDEPADLPGVAAHAGVGGGVRGNLIALALNLPELDRSIVGGGSNDKVVEWVEGNIDNGSLVACEERSACSNPALATGLENGERTTTAGFPRNGDEAGVGREHVGINGAGGYQDLSVAVDRLGWLTIDVAVRG